MLRNLIGAVVVCVLTVSGAFAQDPTGAIEGVVTDKTAGAVAAAKVIVKNSETGFGRDFGKILSAGPPRLMQFGVKLIF